MGGARPAEKEQKKIQQEKKMIIKNESHLWSLYNESRQTVNELNSNFISKNLIDLLNFFLDQSQIYLSYAI